MREFNSITDLATKIKNDLSAITDRKSITLLYAFNSVGKTRLSQEFIKLNDDETGNDEESEPKRKTLCYSAFLEDLFSWDNEENILKFNKYSWEAKLIKDEGLENKIIDNFKNLLNTKIEPSFDLEKGEVVFNIPLGSDENISDIKVSRGEESIFIWSVFYTILETAISELILKEEDRATDVFNDLEYIIIDDPVSSIDDTKIITLAIGVLDLMNSSRDRYLTPFIKKKEIELHNQEFTDDYVETRLKEYKEELRGDYQELTLNFIITTHHPLFYNVLFNSVNRIKKSKAKKYFFILSKNSNETLSIEEQNDDSPFAYHLLVKTKIMEAINSNGLEKYHFNLFRSLLEKTANFLGYRNFKDCISEDEREEFVRIIHLYSHGKLSEIENSTVSDRDKKLFKKAFNEFIENFKYN